MRIVLVDDHDLLRRSVRAALARRGDVEIVGEGAEALEKPFSAETLSLQIEQAMAVELRLEDRHLNNSFPRPRGSAIADRDPCGR